MEKTSILVVEDEAITAMDIESQLQGLGFHVPATVFSGEQAILAAEKYKPDLILMDIVLQGKMDGIEAAQQIMAQLHIPVVFLTAYSDEATFNRAKLALPYGYIIKPFDTRDLHFGIDLALHKYKMEIQSQAEINHVKSELLSNMSHEFRTPLNGIIGLTELIQAGHSGPVTDTQKEHLADILSQSYSLLRMVNSVLDIISLDAHKLAFNFERINLDTLVNEVVEKFHRRLQEKNLKVTIDISEKLKSITSDPTQLMKVISIYIANAIKFSLNAGKIEIHVRPENKNEYRFEVRDYGIGIQKADIKKLFLPFQQLDASMQKKYQGAGVELSLLRLIIEAQHGKVGVDSTPDKGSTFYFILPYSPLHDSLYQYK